MNTVDVLAKSHKMEQTFKLRRGFNAYIFIQSNNDPLRIPTERVHSSMGAMNSNVRDLLARCRHAQEEMLALQRQASHLGAESCQREMESYQRTLDAHRQDMINRLALLEDMISTLQNARSRTIMRYYYTMGWGDAQIAIEMDLTEEWVRKKRYAAIRELEAEWKNALA